MASSPVKDICYTGYLSIMPKTNVIQNIMGADNIALCSNLPFHTKGVYRDVCYSIRQFKYFKAFFCFLKYTGHIDYVCLNFHLAFRDTNKKVSQITNRCT